MGRWGQPLFSQEREVSANPFCVSSGHVQAWREPWGTLDRFQLSGNRCRNVKEIENWRVCKILKWKGKELCPKEDIHDLLEKNADQGFQVECASQTRLCEAQAE